MSRSKLPLPPVPAAARPPRARTPASSTPSAPSTTAAPYQAVPSPEPRPVELPLDDVPAAPQVERRKRPRTAGPALERPRSSWRDAQSALVTTGPSGLRSSAPPPVVAHQTTASGSSAPAYGDWTKPSRSSDAIHPDADVPMAAGALDAPGTTAIPERSVSRRRRPAEPVEALEGDRSAGDTHAADSFADEGSPDQQPGEGAASSTRTNGPVTGGRAAVRAERQAKDAARRKAEKRKGSAVAVLEENEPRRPRRVLKGLIAMTVVALGVLGVYTVVEPKTQPVAAQAPVDDSATVSVAAPTDPLPELEVAPLDVADPAVAAPVRVPVTVLNSTNITGLAAKIAGTVATGGWETPGVGAYTASDVAASTVFFTEGDETQRQAAAQLVEQFPQLQGPAPRFFELPADVVAPGLVVVVTGDWQP